MLGVLGFIFLILFVVGVHELGHLIAAKIFNVYCSEYAIGMGPCLYRKKNKETDFTIRALPIGGFCSMAGESENALEKRTDKEIPYERTLKGAKNWKQAIIYLAGVTMNFITGFIIIVIALMTIQISSTTITEVYENTPAYNNFMVGDKFVAIDGQEINMANELYFNPEGTIYTVLRNNELIDIEISSVDSDVIGVELDTEYMPFKYAFENSFEIFKNFSVAIIDGIKSLFSNLTNVSGVVGLYSFATEAVAEGITVYLLLIALVSINVGIFNLIPLPVMDGGRILILLIEKIMGKKLNKNIETTIMVICSLLLIALILWANGLDVYRLIFKK